MTGKEIRRWARQKGRKERGYFARLSFLALLPGLPGVFLMVLWATSRQRVFPLWILLPLTVLGRGLSLCVDSAALTMIRSGKRQTLSHPLQSGKWKRVLAAALMLTAISELLSWGPSLLQAWGTAQLIEARGETDLFLRMEMYREGMGLSQIGSLLRSVLTSAGSIVLLPVGYLLFLSPEESLPQVFQKGLKTGFRAFWPTLVFFFWLGLPFVGWTLLWSIFIVLLEGLHVSRIYTMPFLSLGLGVWFAGYLELGLARYALELLKPGKRKVSAVEEETPLMARYTQALIGVPPSLFPPPRRIKLRRRGSWYYRDHRRGPLVPGPLERK